MTQTFSNWNFLKLAINKVIWFKRFFIDIICPFENIYLLLPPTLYLRTCLDHVCDGLSRHGPDKPSQYNSCWRLRIISLRGNRSFGTKRQRGFLGWVSGVKHNSNIKGSGNVWFKIFSLHINKNKNIFCYSWEGLVWWPMQIK